MPRPRPARADLPWAVFRWPRPVDAEGYAWTDGRVAPEDETTATRGERRWLVGSRRMPVDDYEPLQTEPALFRRFADIDPSEAAFQAFANRYGALGVGEALAGQGSIVKGEAYRRWIWEQTALARVVAIVAAAQDRDVRALAQWITVSRDRATFAWRDGRRVLWRGTIAIRDDEVWTAVHAGTRRRGEQLARLALFWTQRAINQHLASQHATDALVRPRLLYDRDQSRFGVHVVPTSLAGALWLQCASAIDGDWHYRRCASCGDWFWVSPKGAGKRRHAMNCSQRCKVQGWRVRKRQEKTLTGG